MKLKPTLSGLFLILNFTCFAQYEKTNAEVKDDAIHNQGLLLGAHLSLLPTLEVGYSKYYSSPENTKMPYGGGFGISVENYFLNHDYVMAPKLSVWANAIGINFGGSLPWYTDFEGNNSLKLRPEIGVGYQNIRMNLAYNLPVYNHGLTGVTDFMVSLNYIVPFNKK
jgi:hypothetical protein